MEAWQERRGGQKECLFPRTERGKEILLIDFMYETASESIKLNETTKKREEKIPRLYT